MKKGKQLTKKVNAKAKKETTAKAEPMVAFAVEVAGDAPSIPVQKSGKEKNGRMQRTKSKGHMAETAKSEPVNGAKARAAKGGKPAGQPQRTGLSSPKQEPVLAEFLEGERFVANLIVKAEFSPQELKDWKEYNLDVCATPKCGGRSVYIVEALESLEAPEEQAEAYTYCLPCTQAKLGLKKV